MTNPLTIHDPVQYMVDLRLVLSQGRKRIGLLIGAGAPTALRVDLSGALDDEGRALILDVEGLTQEVVTALPEKQQQVIDILIQDLDAPGVQVNIEAILTRVRMLAQSIGTEEVHGLKGCEYVDLSKRICEEIGNRVRSVLPPSPNPFTDLVLWISGTHREHAIEIFTPNYDLLLEEAFERMQVPFFDGFSGAHRPFFDVASVLASAASAPAEQFPTRWARVWKLHGSLGWAMCDGVVVRTGEREVNELIYPDHLKYDQVRKMPYVALFERLHQFLTTPDTLLIGTGFSFRDPHICAVLDESLTANKHAAVLAFQFGNLADEHAAGKLALQRPNMSVYARDGAIINGVAGNWQPGELPSDDWRTILQTFWRAPATNGPAEFMLGDFSNLARFLALTHAPRLAADESEPSRQSEETQGNQQGEGLPGA